jgi:HK97 family phage portal protein
MTTIQKATDASALIRATLGTPRSIGHQMDVVRVAGDSLVRRYGMWVQRCISINAQAAAAVPFKLLTTRSGGMVAKSWRGARPVSPRLRAHLRGMSRVRPSSSARKGAQYLDDAAEIVQHPLLDLLNNVNEWTDGFAWREALYSDLQIFGRSFQHLVGPEGGAPTELWRFMPQKMKVEPSATDFVSHYEYGNQPDTERFETDEVMWFRLYDPMDPWGGLGPLEAWLKTVDATLALQDFQNWIVKRGGAPDYVVETEHPLQDEQKRAFRKDWKRLFSRFFNRQESVAFMSKGQLHRLGQTNRELEYGESEDRKRDQVANGFGVPKPLVTSDDVNRNTLDGSRQMHMELTVWPMVQRVEDLLNQRLVPLFGDNLVLVHENPIREDVELLVKDRESKLKSGWSINEVRAMEGEEAATGDFADEPLVDGTLALLSDIEAPELSFGPVSSSGGPDASTPPGADESPSVPASADSERRAAFTVESVKGDVTVTPAPQLPMGNSAPVSMKAMMLKDHAGTPESPDGDERLDADMVASVRKTLDRLARDVARELRNTDAPPAPVDDSKAMQTTPLDPEKFLATFDPMEWIEAMIGATMPGVTRMVATAATAGMEAAGVAGPTFSVTNPRVREYLEDTTRRIGREVTDSYRAVIRDQLVAGTQAGETPKQMAGRIAGLTTPTPREVAEGIDRIPKPPFTQAWSERITRTEAAFSSVKGTELGWQQTGRVVGKQFVLAPDACEWCQAVAAELGDGRGKLTDSKTVGLGVPFFGIGKTLKATFAKADGTEVERTMVLDYAPDDTALVIPPVHPHCRCSVRPVLEGEA